MAEDGGDAVQSLEGVRPAAPKRSLAMREPSATFSANSSVAASASQSARPRSESAREDVSACVEDVAIRVAERAALDPGLGVRYESSFFRMPRKTRNRRQ